MKFKVKDDLLTGTVVDGISVVPSMVKNAGHVFDFESVGNFYRIVGDRGLIYHESWLEPVKEILMECLSCKSHLGVDTLVNNGFVCHCGNKSFIKVD